MVSGGSAEPPFTIPSYSSGRYMAVIAFHHAQKLIRENYQTWLRSLDVRDMRDPLAIGVLIINRPKGESACQAADRADTLLMPKYH